MGSRSASLLHADLVALLAACRFAPADDTPRLVLADWLDDNADATGLPAPDDARARAALIRVQLELARPTYDTARIVQLRAAEAQLLSVHAARWLGALPQRLDELRRRKPFGFAAHRAPAVPQVFVLDPLAVSKPNNPWRFHRGLLTVDLFSSELLDPELGAWFAAPQAAWVEEAGVEIGGLAALERLEVPDALRPYLGVRYALGRAPPPSLHLVNPPVESLTPKRCRRLVRGRNFALVRALTLYAPAIAAEVLTALVGANVSALLRLSVKAPIGDAGAGLLGAAPLVTLSALDISGCAIGADGLRLLARSAHLQQLVSLTAFRNQFGCAGAEALAASPMAGRLNVLEIQNTGIGDRGAAALADSPVLDRLVGPGLNLSMNPIGDDGAKALAACPLLEPFTELVLRDCHIGDAGVAALAGSPHVANLTYLDLWHNRVGDDGARALAASPHLNGVRDLSLRDNRISAAGADALRAKFAERVKVEVARSLR